MTDKECLEEVKNIVRHLLAENLKFNEKVNFERTNETIKRRLNSCADIYLFKEEVNEFMKVEMYISYLPLIEKIRERKLKWKDIREATGLSARVIAKLNNDEVVSMETLLKLCEYFDCQLSDICIIKP